MYAREYMEACMTFVEFGKIKDIDFENELWNEEICEGVTIRGVNFFDNTITLGTSVDAICGYECCGDYIEHETYDLDRLASKGHLGKLIDMMDDVLSNKLNL
jgi:hypothetical protein